MKIEVDYGDDHNGGDCRAGEQKRWKGKEMNGIPMFPERNWNTYTVPSICVPQTKLPL